MKRFRKTGPSLTYKGSGVDYGALDPGKKSFAELAASTASNIADTDVRELSHSRGESFYARELPDRILVGTIEGLGTRNKPAEIAAEFTGEWQHYFAIGYSNAATALNDLYTSGGRALTFALHIATGSAAWMKNQKCMSAFAQGTKKACDDACCTWGPGETSSLRDIVERTTACIGGHADGQVIPKENLTNFDKIEEGDAIILIASSGIHDNGITLTRDLPMMLPQGYSTRMPGGQMFFHALLTPTIIYGMLILAICTAGIPIHYIVNITGHGWRKLMRAKREFVYRIKRLLPIHPIFKFIQKHGNITDEEMWGNYNMCAGYALYVPQRFAKQVISIARQLGYKAIIAGTVESGSKKVIIEPIGLTFDGKALDIRS